MPWSLGSKTLSSCQWTPELEVLHEHQYAAPSESPLTILKSDSQPSLRAASSWELQSHRASPQSRQGPRHNFLNSEGISNV